ncbi:hypothetical protein ACM01_27130 [Streptomyces viridochromogenes]|uniref:DUF397 domain-containing protein n=1 Tax=Streptomyces viridochromogenes TaxID=1938 RepID=A0A0J7Z7E9_STRVR|nr:DUF397 domain-containing protein [Streptomyces viridochromogenes]KMS71432.1 hypothetical protein ACM01_27130 [Streptomyces viridochromogenes]
MTEHTVPSADIFSGWRKSTYSGTESNSCLEVLDNHPCGVPVRDSKNPHGPALLFSAANWSAFVAAVKESRP